MFLALALSALALAPQASQRPLIVPADLSAPAAPARESLAERIAQARLRAAPPPVALPDLREQQRLAAAFPERPADGLGSAARRLALGQRPLTVRADERLGSEGRRAALANPQLPKKRARR